MSDSPGHAFRIQWFAAKIGTVVWVLLAALVVCAVAVPGKEPARLPASAKPVRLVVPSLHTRAQVVPIRITSYGALDPPRDYHIVGWWRRSATPGEERGQTVLTGHTVHTGGGVMDHLGRMRPGDRIKVITHKGTALYRATRVKDYTRAGLAKRARYLFNQHRTPSRLLLISCTGWTGTDYTGNVVVFASSTGVRLHHKHHKHHKHHGRHHHRHHHGHPHH